MASSSNKRKGKTLLDYVTISKKPKNPATDNTITNVDTLNESSTSLVRREEICMEKSKEVNVSRVNESEISEDRDPANGCEKAKTFLAVGVGPYQPKLKEYPQKNGRKFRYEWYTEFNWLEYSVVHDAAFCYCCRAFGESVSKSEDAFTKNGYSNWKKAVEKFRNHQMSHVHTLCALKVSDFRNTRLSGTILSKLDSQRSTIVSENRQYLEAVLDSLLYCAKQCIPIRGHREDEASGNKGNLLELLSLRSKDSNIILRYYMNKENTFKYVSPEYQNNFLNLLSKNVLDQIISKVKTAGIYGVIMDETQDLKRHEQVSIVLRYCDNTLTVFENFIGFYRTDSADGQSLCVLLKNVLTSFGLKIQDIRAQCYDGAAAMRGQYSGVAKRIRDDNDLAMYVHCYAHILNLCIVDISGEIAAIRNMFGVLNSLHTFIQASYKRHAVFEHIHKQVEDSRHGPKIIKPLSDTRWNCRIQAIRAVLNNFSTVLATLEEISDKDKVSGPEAHALFKSVNDFTFLFCLKLMKIVLEHTNQLSLNLQNKSSNFSTVILLSQSTISMLLSLRSDKSFDDLWKETQEMAEHEGCNAPNVPRKRKVPQKFGGRGEVLAEYKTAADYYRVNVYFPVIDTLISDIKNKFQENDLKILHALRLVLSENEPSKENISLVSSTYKIDEQGLTSELNVFSHMCMEKQTENNFDSRYKLFVENKLYDCFPNLNEVFKIFLTVPITSASSERSFSCLRHLKTYVRNTIGQERLCSLAVLCIERSHSINTSEIIDAFDAEATLCGRRLQLH